MAAKNGVEKLKEGVDTLLVIPNDKLLGLSDKALLLEDAFLLADSVLRYTIEGITNIVSNRETVNLDFNDLRTTLLNKGIGYLGIGTVDAGDPIIEAVKQAINSPMLETTIEGAENLLINTSGKVNVMALNDAISYVKELAGSKVNIIWSTVTQKNYDENKVVVTLIATGMAKEKKVSETRRQEPKRTDFPSFLRMPPEEGTEPAEYIVRKPKEEGKITIPPFLLNAGTGKKHGGRTW